ncbi:hypothetical protein PoB_001485300 [Plakobranchus ocellatus]|uniref:Uncharacterized protein n=1 Tax=Plakobranchus ocellatus TaxID=259542 RepID=A0AAV3Z156_9GAST|nr:hypothetical protein PoB_001485300 [Plakobranchus ocellatus]
MSEQGAVMQEIPMTQSSEEATNNDPSTLTQAEDLNVDKGEQHENTAFETEEPATLPPLTYIDFIPQCLGSTIEGKEPDFAEFSTVVEQANQWLASMPQFIAIRCETISTKLGKDYNLDNDATLTHCSSNGRNVYLRVLRLWVTPRAENAPLASPQQISYITVLPDHPNGDLSTFLSSLAGGATNRTVGDLALPTFDNMQETVDKLNKHLQAKPLPGKILCIETLSFKCQESNTSDKLKTEASVWSEGGANARVFLQGLRVFYVVGQPAYETIGIHDEEPDMMQSVEGMGLRLKFATFDQTVTKAAAWLKKEKGIRVVSVQSVNVKLDRKFGTGPWILDSNAAAFTENQSLIEKRYAKVLRISYVREQKLEMASAVSLTSRLFIPHRIEGKTFESFSKTVLRVIKWLNATNAPVFACETVKYHVSADSTGQGFNDDRMDFQVNSNLGQYYITCIRLFFPCAYQEPPPEVPNEEDLGWGWGCVVS